MDLEKIIALAGIPLVFARIPLYFLALAQALRLLAAWILSRVSRS